MFCEGHHFGALFGKQNKLNLVHETAAAIYLTKIIGTVSIIPLFIFCNQREGMRSELRT